MANYGPEHRVTRPLPHAQRDSPVICTRLSASVQLIPPGLLYYSTSEQMYFAGLHNQAEDSTMVEIPIEADVYHDKRNFPYLTHRTRVDARCQTEPQAQNDGRY